MKALTVIIKYFSDILTCYHINQNVGSRGLCHLAGFHGRRLLAEHVQQPVMLFVDVRC